MRTIFWGICIVGLLAVHVVASGAEGRLTGGNTVLQAPQTPSPAPKIVSISPSSLVLDSQIDGQKELVLVLRGENLAGADTVTFESQPSTGLRRCTELMPVHASEVRCKITSQGERSLASALTQMFQIGVPVRFTITVKQNGKHVVSEASTAAFTLVKPILATEMCVTARPNSDIQIHLRASGLVAGVTVRLSSSITKATCTNLQIFGSEDLVCYVPNRIFQSLTKAKMDVQILRPGEHGLPNLQNITTRSANSKPPQDRTECEPLDLSSDTKN